MSNRHTASSTSPSLLCTYHNEIRSHNNSQNHEQIALALIRTLHNGTCKEKLGALNLLDLTYRQYKNVLCLQGIKAALQDESASVRERCAEILGEVGKNASLATANLTCSLKDVCPSVRAQAARALGQLGTPSAYVTEKLCDVLNDTDVHVRYQTAIALGKLRVTGIRVVLALENALSDRNRLVQKAARESLRKLHLQRSTAGHHNKTQN